MDSLPSSSNRESFDGFDLTDDEVPDGPCRHIAIELKHIFEGMVLEANDVNEELFLAKDLAHALRELMGDPSQASLDHLLYVSPALIDPVRCIQQLVTARMF